MYFVLLALWLVRKWFELLPITVFTLPLNKGSFISVPLILFFIYFMTLIQYMYISHCVVPTTLFYWISTALRKFMNEKEWIIWQYHTPVISLSWIAKIKCLTLLQSKVAFSDKGVKRHLAKIKYSLPFKTHNVILTLAIFATIVKA